MTLFFEYVTGDGSEQSKTRSALHRETKSSGIGALVYGQSQPVDLVSVKLCLFPAGFSGCATIRLTKPFVFNLFLK